MSSSGTLSKLKLAFPHADAAVLADVISQLGPNADMAELVLVVTELFSGTASGTAEQSGGDIVDVDAELEKFSQDSGNVSNAIAVNSLAPPSEIEDDASSKLSSDTGSSDPHESPASTRRELTSPCGTNDVASEVFDVTSMLISDLRLEAKPNEAFNNAILMLLKVLQNVVDHPEEERYRSLNCASQKLQDQMLQFPAALALLQLAGFTATGPRLEVPPYLSSRCHAVAQTIALLVESDGITVSHDHINIGSTRSGNSDSQSQLSLDDLRRLRDNKVDLGASGNMQVGGSAGAQKKREAALELAARKAQRRERLAKAAETRVGLNQSMPRQEAGPAAREQNKGRVSRPEMWGQLKAARGRIADKWKNKRVGRVVTLNSFLEQEQEKYRNAPMGGTSTDVEIGKSALEGTNKFRQLNGLPPLQWHGAIAAIGRKHSKDMGDGKVPFGHTGFQQGRSKQIMAATRGRSAAENVAMNHGLRDVAGTAVQGWIDSPGHRANLLTKNARYCGIGVYRAANGAHYLTQLFG